MANIDDLYKEAGIRPGNQAPSNFSQKPGSGKGPRKIIGIVSMLVIIGAMASLFSNKGLFKSLTGSELTVGTVIIIILFFNIIVRFIVKQIRKNKNVETYNGQS